MNGLSRLLSSLAEPVVDVRSFSRQSNVITLGVAVWDDEGPDDEGNAQCYRWQIACTGALDYRIVPGPGSLEVHGESHPAVRRFLEPGGNLFFTLTAGSDVLPIAEALRRVHAKVAGDLIPFEHYLNSRFTVEELLRKASGSLASGPAFLMDAYASAVEPLGVSVTRVGVHHAGVNLPRRPGEDRLSLLKIRTSFVVARELRAELVAEERTSGWTAG
jgi:hypothetical protein